MKKRTMVTVAACLLCMALGMGLHAALPGAGAAEAGTTTAAPADSLAQGAGMCILESQLGRVDTVIDRIIAREVIESPLLVYITDPALEEQLEHYNAETDRWAQHFHGAGLRICTSLFMLEDAQGLPLEHMYAGDWLAADPRITDMAARIAHYALYANVRQLCQNDPMLGAVLAAEGGGSAGMWHIWLHDMDTEENQAELDAYLALEGTLLPALEAYKAALAGEAAGW